MNKLLFGIPPGAAAPPKPGAGNPPRSPRAMPILPGIGGAPNRAFCSRSLTAVSKATSQFDRTYLTDEHCTAVELRVGEFSLGAFRVLRVDVFNDTVDVVSTAHRSILETYPQPFDIPAGVTRTSENATGPTVTNTCQRCTSLSPARWMGNRDRSSASAFAQF